MAKVVTWHASAVWSEGDGDARILFTSDLLTFLCRQVADLTAASWQAGMGHGIAVLLLNTY